MGRAIRQSNNHKSIPRLNRRAYQYKHNHTHIKCNPEPPTSERQAKPEQKYAYKMSSIHILPQQSRHSADIRIAMDVCYLGTHIDPIYYPYTRCRTTPRDTPPMSVMRRQEMLQKRLNGWMDFHLGNCVSVWVCVGVAGRERERETLSSHIVTCMSLHCRAAFLASASHNSPNTIIAKKNPVILKMLIKSFKVLHWSAEYILAPKRMQKMTQESRGGVLYWAYIFSHCGTHSEFGFKTKGCEQAEAISNSQCRIFYF